LDFRTFTGRLNRTLLVYYKMFSTVQQTVQCDFLGVAGSLLWTQLAERYEKTVAVCDDAGRCEMRGVRLGQPRHSELEVEKPVHPEPSANSSSRGTPSGWAVRYENSIRMRWRASRAVGIILESMIHDCRPHESAREILADFLGQIESV
jgi:hypothetical protein